MVKVDSMKRMRLVISGRVQGVCYRMYAREQATNLGLTGWVKNRPDGTVEVFAEGNDDSLRHFHDWCKKGPPYAHVTNVLEKPAYDEEHFDEFTIA
ncbi:MAG: acylphosphatase [Lentisphaerae bacterium]|nr:acylphosphatase [Lentisphaerota bacterium]